MGRGHPGLPLPKKKILSKSHMLKQLAAVDSVSEARNRVLNMEKEFRAKVQGHSASLPKDGADFQKFKTNPFVLMIHAFHREYDCISQIEEDIPLSKLFSSMETSAGRMVEEVVLPEYGWECVASTMHSQESALDGRRVESGFIRLATLKSGPRCLNDEMSENFADSIIANLPAWAAGSGVKEVDFTYGVLYGTRKQSNKKDWHILRNIEDKLPPTQVLESPTDQWCCRVSLEMVEATVTVRIGHDWWSYLGGVNCLVEVCAAMIRACIQPGAVEVADNYRISDLSSIVAEVASPDYNVSLLQRSQLPWFYFMLWHFCDELSS